MFLLLLVCAAGAESGDRKAWRKATEQSATTVPLLYKSWIFIKPVQQLVLWQTCTRSSGGGVYFILKCSCWTWPGQALMSRLEHFHIKNLVSFKALWATGGIRRGCSSLLLLTLAQQNICPISGSLNMHAAAVSAVAHTCRILFYLAKLCSCLTLNEKG